MIGIFDSGLGGLALLGELQRRFPQGDFSYFGDTAAGPFDDKSPGLVAASLTRGLARLTDQGAAVLVVADHCAAACLTPEISGRLPVPVFDILTHGVVPAATALSPGSIGIVGPAIVERSGAHRRAVEEALPGARVYVSAAPLLSPLVEARWLKKPETVMIVKKALHFFKLRQVSALVPAGNHYRHLLPVIQRKIGRRARVVDSVSELARTVTDFLSGDPDTKARCTGSGNCRVAVSDFTDGMERAARLFYGKNIRIDPA